MSRISACLLALSLWTGFAAHASAQALPSNSIDGIVAVVDEDVILRSELDQATHAIRTRLANQPEQLPPADVLEKQVLERLVMMRLQLQRADAMGLKVGDVELDQTLARIAQQQGSSIEDMRAQLARDGMSYEDFREQVRDEIIVSRLQQNFVQSRVSVSESEIDNAIAARGEGHGQVHLGYLLVALPDGATPEQIQVAQSKIDGIHKLIADGEMDFSAAAMRYSDHQTALEGGDMGWRSVDEIPPAFGQILADMQPGDVSKPLRGVSGFSLLNLVERRDQAVEIVTEYHALSLMVRRSDVVTMEQAHEKIKALEARIRGGEDFADVARKDSDDQITRARGGDMGWFKATDWGASVAREIVELKDGELSEPFASDIGWHLIKRLETRQQDVTEETERRRVREQIVRRKADEEYDRYLRELRSEAYVDERLGGTS
ncbi:MAG TPA: peptidylprolyl isomerase [Chiayiivirga sp.]|nr:peptidylprolyl isomerase [Chiayiivirga sp.]